MNIEKPSKHEIKLALTKWYSLENYVLQEKSLKKLFTITYPLNNDIDDVLIKVCALNDFYSTNIFSPYAVAKHILSLNLDEELQSNNLNIVNVLSRVDVGDNRSRNFYSFATKYCSHHRPLSFPIYDSFAEKILLHFKKIDNFAAFAKESLKDYQIYNDILLKFISFYGLEEFTLKDIDRYLWLKGKEKFPKSYR